MRRTLILAALLLATFPALGQADTLFSQPYAGAALAWGSDLGYLPYPQLVADDFTLLTPATLTDFHWWGAYGSTPDPADAPTDAWSLTFYPDLASLQSFTNGTAVSLTNLSRTFIGDYTPSLNAIFSYTADLVSPLTLGAGTYYALLAGNTGPPRYSGWITVPNTGAGTWIRSLNGTTWGQQATGQAFEITGTPVPEPASLLLLGTGLAGLARWRRRRM